MSIIMKVCNLSRCFQSGKEIIWALKGINLEIPKGAHTILAGRSGSGKTTLLNLLGALDKPTEGSICFNGADISAMDEEKRDELRRKSMGFVFQSGALLSYLTAYENVDLALRLCGLNHTQRKRRIEEALTMVGLRQRMHHRPHELSGGEQQRVAIARAIAHRPEIIFADEPTAELDTGMGHQVMKVFRTLVEKEGITIVMTTHDMSFRELADYYIELKDGMVAMADCI